MNGPSLRASAVAGARVRTGETMLTLSQRTTAAELLIALADEMRFLRGSQYDPENVEELTGCLSQYLEAGRIIQAALSRGVKDRRIASVFVEALRAALPHIPDGERPAPAVMLGLAREVVDGALGADAVIETREHLDFEASGVLTVAIDVLAFALGANDREPTAPTVARLLVRGLARIDKKALDAAMAVLRRELGAPMAKASPRKVRPAAVSRTLKRSA